jgi:predicted dehydrogenase
MYRVGVVGLSGISLTPAKHEPFFFGGEHPHAHVACYANHPRTEIVAVCDIMPAAFDRFDELWGHRWSNVARYTDYRAMFANEQLDLVSVVTPDHLHAGVVEAAVAAGIKAIYCEKPIATTLADADRMIQVTEAAGVPMSINHTRRWYDVSQYVKTAIASGEFGRVTHIHALTTGPRAMLFRNGTHLIDIATFFADGEPVWVSGFLDPGHEAYGPVYAGDGGRDPAFDPGGSGLVKFDNGVLLSFVVSKQIQGDGGGWELSIDCEHARLRITEPGGLEIITEPETGTGGLSRRRVDLPRYKWTDGTAAIDELIGMIEGVTTVSQSSPREARKTLAIILALLQSQANGNQPVVAPFTDAS